jgi:hypothetical protein
MTAITLTAGGVSVFRQLDLPDRNTQRRAAAVDIDAGTASQRARDTGTIVEASAENTATNTTYAHPDGTFTRRMSVAPVRVHKDGRWTPIDTTLDHTGDGWTTRATASTVTVGGGQRSPAASAPPTAARPTSPTPTDARTSSGQGGALRAPAGGAAGELLGQELVRMSTDAHELALYWSTPLAAPHVAGDRALYRNVLTGVDLLVTALPDGFSQVLIVRDRTAAANPALRTLTYGLTSDTLRFSLDESGAIQALDSNGAEIAAAPTPYMWDSAGTTADLDPVSDPDPVIPGLENLRAIGGPLSGARDAIVKTSLAGDTLTLEPAADLLDNPDTVYPVFVDPSFKGHTQAWTLVYKNHPSSSFWNGKGFNGGTDEARAGFESQTWGTGRSYFRVNWDLEDAVISSARFRILETHSWSCRKRDIELWSTKGISAKTTWNNQPGNLKLQDKVNAAHGYNSSCPNDWIGFNALDAAKAANKDGWDSITFKLEASNENDKYSWKKFEDKPYIDVAFNRLPLTPTNLQNAPFAGCRTAAPYPVLGITDVTIKAKARDIDQNLKSIDVKLWASNDAAHPVFDGEIPVKIDKTAPQYGTIDKPFDDTKFKNNTTYLWNATAVDTAGARSKLTSATCRFVVDHAKPNPPTVESVEFPKGDEGDKKVWLTELSKPGTFTFTGGGDDTVKYIYSLDSTTYDRTATMTGTTGTADAVVPAHAGPVVLYAKSVDKAGNQSDATQHLFYVKPRDTVDGPADTTGDTFPDLFAVNSSNDLELYASDETGDINQALTAARGAPAGYWAGALITHHGDYWPGDGLQDLIARMPDKKLWVYPGNGRGGVDIQQRVALRLPTGAPDPGTYRQILSVGDIDTDGQPDLLVTTGDQLWALVGYTGAHISQAVKLPSTEWTNRTIISVADHNGDGAVDLVYRAAAGALFLRHGKKAGTKTDLNSLATAASSATGKDTAYSSASWDTANIRLTAGTPHPTGDNKPDIWVIKTDNTVWLYPGGATVQGTGRKIAAVTDGRNWTDTKAIG